MTEARLPILLELEERSWSEQLDRVEPWLATTRTLQTSFRRLLQTTVGDLGEHHVRERMEDVLAAAHRHEALVDDLSRGFGREPAESGPFGTAAGLLSRTRHVVGRVEGLAGGPRGSAWRAVRELLLTNLDAIGAFAVTEQLALALGRPAVVDLVVPAIEQKSEHQLFLRETMLEMALGAILQRRGA